MEDGHNDWNKNWKGNEKEDTYHIDLAKLIAECKI